MRRGFPEDVHRGGLAEEALEELPGNERLAVDRDRRDRHLDQIVAHHAIATVRTEARRHAVDRHPEAAAVRRDRAAETRGHFFRGDIDLPRLLDIAEWLRRRGRAQRGLAGCLRERDRRTDDQGSDEREECANREETFHGSVCRQRRGDYRTW